MTIRDPSTAIGVRPLDLHLYLAGRFINTLAIQIVSVALGWHVYDITRDPFVLGYIGLAQFLPMIVLVLPAGDIADRFDRRVILAGAYLVEAAAVALLLTLTATGSTSTALFYAVAVLLGTARGFLMPAQQSLLPFLVPTETLPRAIAWSSSTYLTATLTGPAVGGLLYAFDPDATFAICFLLCLAPAAAMTVLRMRVSEAGPGLRGSAVERITEGLRYMWHRPVILGAISLDLFAVLFGGAVALLPIFASDILHAGPEGLGLLRSAPAAGAALVALTLGRWPLKRHAGTLMYAAVAVFGVATIVFGLSTNFYLSLAALGVSGAADMISVYIRSAFVQLATPDHMRGRVSAVNAMFIGASNELGEFESGVAAGFLGAVPAVVLGGAATLGVAALWMRLFPPLRRVDRFSDIDAG